MFERLRLYLWLSLYVRAHSLRLCRKTKKIIWKKHSAHSLTQKANFIASMNIIIKSFFVSRLLTPSHMLQFINIRINVSDGALAHTVYIHNTDTHFWPSFVSPFVYYYYRSVVETIFRRIIVETVFSSQTADWQNKSLPLFITSSTALFRRLCRYHRQPKRETADDWLNQKIATRGHFTQNND